MSMMYIQFQYHESQKTHLNLECVQWYSIYVPMVVETYVVQNISARYESFQQSRLNEFVVQQLVEAGFSCTNHETMECKACGLKFHHTSVEGNPYKFHQQSSPNCEFFKEHGMQNHENNMTYGVDGFARDESRALQPSPSTSDQADYVFRDDGRIENEEETTQRSHDSWYLFQSCTPKYPKYAVIDARITSYENASWPRDNVCQTPRELAAAGFFYTGYKDAVRCYYCDGLLPEWEPEDDPWVKHARRFPRCKFLLTIKGKDFVQAINNPVNGCQEPVASSAVPQNNGHYRTRIRNEKMVEAGFPCKDPNTPTVECKSRRLELNSSTLNGINPMQYHSENSPDCELFHQTNSQRPRGQQNRPLTDSSPNPAVPPIGVKQEAAARSLVQQPPGNNQKKQSTQANVSYAQTHSGNSNGNICIDEATSPNSHRQAAKASPLFSNSRGASLDLLTADERPRTGEASDRTVSTVQNNNNLSSSGEEVRENENMIGALGGENPHRIRNPRYTEQKTRRESFAHWPHRARHDIEGLVNAGFFYTGAKDIVRCFFCDIGLAEWNPDDDPWVEDARHSPECPYLRDQKGQDYINNFQTQWARIYTPKHPQYTQMDARRRSYVNTGWPRDNVLQTPELLAAAGFFYTGDGDKVRCHYCDGGLQEWEPEDDPWVEHARWFPFCKFLLKIKGIDFIQASATGNPDNGFQEPVASPAVPQNNAHYTPKIRNEKMSRISSYSIWPHRNIRTGPLVEAGFSCKDPNTPTVECKSCGLEINASNLNGMNPMQYHRENSSDCELFHQTNSERPTGQQNRPLTDSSPNPVVPPVGVNQEAAARSLVQQPPGSNQQKHPNQVQAQMEKQSEANVSSAQTRSGNNNGNVCIDEATLPNSHRQAANASSLLSNSRGASLGSLTLEERPRTGEVSDRSVSNLQNNNGLSSRGEEVRENENMIGALGGEIPDQIRNPRYTEQNARREGLVNAGFFYTDDIPGTGSTLSWDEEEDEIDLGEGT